MDYDQLEARFWHALAFLKEEALGALWRPLWRTLLGMTVGVTLLYVYPLWRDASSIGVFLSDILAAPLLGLYLGVFVAVPVASGTFCGGCSGGERS